MAAGPAAVSFRGDFNMNGGGGGLTGNGGSFVMQGGSAGESGGSGGAFTAQGGESYDAAGTGGHCTLQSGNNFGGGTKGSVFLVAPGSLKIRTGASVKYALINADAIATTDKTFTLQNLSHTITGQAAALTSTRVPFADANGLLTDDADMTFATDTLTVTGLKVGTTKVSSYNGIATVSNGIPSELATVDLASQGAAIGATTIYTPAATGLFRLCCFAQVTRAATTSSTLGGSGGGLTITFTDGDGSVAQSVKIRMNLNDGTNNTVHAGNTTTSNMFGQATIYAKTGVAIQYAFGYTSSGATTMLYSLHVKVEAL
jgi:hypothetical protein